MSKAAKKILDRQLRTRAALWPNLDERELWHRGSAGWVAVPRLMPLIMSIMDDLSGTGFPVSRTYFEMWTRLRDEGFLTLNRPEEMAFHAGFDGQRALRTWKDRVRRLHQLGFVDLKDGPLGEFSYALFINPYYVIKRAALAGKVQKRKWEALVIRANDLEILDIDDIDDSGKLISQQP